MSGSSSSQESTLKLQKWKSDPKKKINVSPQKVGKEMKVKA